MILTGAGYTYLCRGPRITANTDACALVNNYQWGGRTMVAADFTGDGSDDLIVYDGASFKLIKGADGAGNATALPDLMVQATKGPSGAVSSFEYKPLTNLAVYTPATGVVYPSREIRTPRYVLSKFTYPNGAGGSNHRTFGYKKALASLDGRGFLGYEQILEIDDATQRQVYTTRSQVYPHFGRVTVLDTLVDWQFVGHQARTLGAIANFEGRPASALISETISSIAGLDGQWQSDFISYGYDSCGSVTSVEYAKTEFTYPSALRKREIRTLGNDPTTWPFGVPVRRTTTSWNDEGLAVTQRSDFTTLPGTRLLQTETREPATQYTFTTTYTRDAFGNALSATVSANDIGTRNTSNDDDPKGRFVTSTTNALNKTTQSTFDPKFGGQQSSTDPNSLQTTWGYDVFGRRTLETRPDATQTVWTYIPYCCNLYGLNPGLTYVIAENATGKPPTYRGYDDFDRLLLTQKTNFAGTEALYSKNIWYNAAGKVVRSYLPYQDSQATKPYESMTYDSFGRLETKVAADGNTTSYVYNVYWSAPNAGPITTYITNSRNYTTSYVRNLRGQLRAVTDTNGKNTFYEYAPTGQLSKVTDARENLTSYVYDQYGRLTSRTDPDLGTWTFTNNSIDQLINHVDAKGQTINYTYDKLGRKITRGEPNTVATWTWDVATKGIGKLASSTAAVSGGNLTRGYSYDVFGRASTESLAYPSGAVFTMMTSYDTSGRPSVLAYPSGFAVKQVYNATGWLSEVRDNATNALYWRANTMTAAGITDEDYGNGTGVTHVFDPLTYRVNQLSASRDSDNVQLQGYNYSYDVVGNLASRTETVTNVGETFAYDALDRLTIVNQVTGTVYKTFGYDDIGNLTSKSDVGSYTYPTTGKVHAVSSVPGTNYMYDANGNLSNTGFANFTWTVSNMPNVITAGSWNYTC